MKGADREPSCLHVHSFWQNSVGNAHNSFSAFFEPEIESQTCVCQISPDHFHELNAAGRAAEHDSRRGPLGDALPVAYAPQHAPSRVR